LPGHFHYITLGSNRLNTQFLYKPITPGLDAGPILAWSFDLGSVSYSPSFFEQ
jgi:hypothetical protein